jgi:phosphatidylglycerophosphate synthase
VRAERPDLARQSRRWAAAGAGAWLTLAGARVAPFDRRVRAGLGWWAATAVMLDWHLGMVETEDGRPRPLGPADALTLLRVWLAPAVLDDPRPALVAVAGASDVLDGVIARAGEPTRIGRDLEGLADACFAAAALRGARRRGLVGPAVTAAELARLGAGVGYALAVWFGTASPPDPALLRAARLTTPVRVGGLVAAGLGRRRAAEALLLAGCLASVAAVGRALGGDQNGPRRVSPSGSRPSRPT